MLILRSYIDYAAGETIQRAQRRFEGFALITRGKATLLAPNHSGELIQVGELGPGECFGDQFSVGTASSELTIVAKSDLKVMVFDSKIMGELFSQSPTLVAEVGDAIEAQRNALAAARYRKVV